MQSLRNHLFEAIALIIILAGVAFTQGFLPPPVFNQVNYFRTANIDKMTLEKALELSKRHASFFLAPFDAVVLHVEVEGKPRDVFIISDISQQRLTIWQCTVPDASGNREIEAVTAYYGEEGDSLLAPSGLDTNAKNRLFIGGRDLIYLADRGNGRIIEYTYIPDLNGGQLVINRKLGQGQLHYPMDVAISAYGNQETSDADLYVVDAGTFNEDGSLVRINIKGEIEGNWNAINFPESAVEAVRLTEPVSVACYPDTIENTTVIYIVDATHNLLYCLRSDGNQAPVFGRVRSIPCGKTFAKAGGIALDDFGRVYVANNAAGKIEIYGPYFMPQYEPYGEPGTGNGELNYPVNLLIDTYNKPAEGLLLEVYDRFSGIRSFLIDEAATSPPPPLGFTLAGLPKKSAGNESSIPAKFQLGEAFPNPFNSNCIISFSTNQQAQINIDIFNVLGQKVAVAFSGFVSAGRHTAIFNGGNLGSGIYLYRMTVPNYAETRKVVLIK
jgi:hypothetical protein